MRLAVLDSCAVLALFFDEPGAEVVERLLQVAAEADRPLAITAINWAEVLYKMEGRQGSTGLALARQFERTTPVEVVAVDRDLAETAAHLKVERHLGLAGACAAALAKVRKAELITADAEFKPLEGEIKIRWLQ